MSQIIAFSRRFGLDKIIADDFIIFVQNTSLFSIGLASLFSCVQYNFIPPEMALTDIKAPFEYLMPVVGVHAVIDFVFNKSIDLKIHHSFIVGVILYNYYYNVCVDDRFLFLYSFLKTEISSIFYVLKYWIPEKSVLSSINNVVFLLSFLKFRILDVYYEIIEPNEILVPIAKYSPVHSVTNLAMTSIFLASCYGLFILNLYWFSILTKIIYKMITKVIPINNDIVCHYLCAYIHFLTIPISVYMYSYGNSEHYILDVFGIIGLSITSYFYHYDIYNRLKTKQITDYILPNKHNIELFFNDNVFIHIRSFLTLATSYFYNDSLFVVLYLSGLLHFVSMYNVVILSYTIFQLDEASNIGYFFDVYNIITGLPIALDVFFVYMNSPYEIATPFLFTNIIIAIILFVKPYYKLTHVAFHILLVFHAYYLSRSHSEKLIEMI